MRSFLAAVAFFFFIWLISFIAANTLDRGFKFSAEVGLFAMIVFYGLVESFSDSTPAGSSEEETLEKPPEPPNPGVDTYV